MPFSQENGIFGAGGRTRTGTVSPPVDFESTTSANSITPANINFITHRHFVPVTLAVPKIYFDLERR